MQGRLMAMWSKWRACRALRALPWGLARGGGPKDHTRLSDTAAPEAPEAPEALRVAVAMVALAAHRQWSVLGSGWSSGRLLR